MHEYDTVLKALLQSPQSTVLERITGARIVHWLNVEFSEVKQLRVDMLGTTEDPADLVSIELQSTNDNKMPIRMAEYALSMYRQYTAFPRQYVLYVGEEKMRMTSELVSPNFQFRYTLIDIRDLDEDALLNSPFDSDSILAILTRHKNRRETIRRILAKIATLEGGRRGDAFKKLTILAGLRHLGDEIRAEAKDMPILNDIMDHDLLGPTFRDGERNMLRRLLNKRFGMIPAWVDEQLSNLSATELEQLSLRIFDVSSLDELFRR